MTKMVKDNNWILVIGGELPKMKKNKYIESVEQRAARKIRDRARNESKRR
jgi:hypothetical protein